MKKVIDNVYLITSIVGAFLVAINAGYQVIGFSLFLVSSLCGCYLVVNSNASRNLLYVNMMFAMINVVGIIRA